MGGVGGMASLASAATASASGASAAMGASGTGGTGASSTPGAAAPGGALNENTFLQLLVAQMQYQNPLQPMSSTAFVTQLAQFEMLSVLQGIQADLNSMSAADTVASKTGGSGTASVSASTSGSGSGRATTGGGGTSALVSSSG